mmetsp:Transcript_30922/g.45833  ORF Transcript_30922/g.45833 Transcript_30922/m.45833 type:complete len:553 (-) Transcript_30922:59-1717(-)|eukprot:CAMPEP_0194043746 /NCGR_PEP_ID=MMETSP0009_2-20130614/15316_1 /TAXON_ID=210454 /ORGANISM="Grammatophora oceanica, Strain CCMP 410" /LENGTH=552 /DNA_ID=CAMNT_0038688057 /DNA_START=26 /DNA_END=1684 /DNA_ORIENTATION=+
MDNNPDDSNAPPYRDVDVLLGRQKFCRNNGGNLLLKRLVEERMDEYDMADKSTDYMDVGKKKNKLDIKREIIAGIHTTGGRFLRYIAKEKRWIEVSEKASIEKVKDRFTVARKALGPTRRQELLDRMLGGWSSHSEAIPMAVPSNPVVVSEPASTTHPIGGQAQPNTIEAPVPIAVHSSSSAATAAIATSQRPSHEERDFTQISTVDAWTRTRASMLPSAPLHQIKQPPQKVLQLASAVATAFNLTSSASQHHETTLFQQRLLRCSARSSKQQQVRKRKHVVSLSQHLSAIKRRVRARSTSLEHHQEDQPEDCFDLNVLAEISSTILCAKDLHRAGYDDPSDTTAFGSAEIAQYQPQPMSTQSNLELLSDIATAVSDSGKCSKMGGNNGDRYCRKLETDKGATDEAKKTATRRSTKSTKHVSQLGSCSSMTAHDITFPSSILMTMWKDPILLENGARLSGAPARGPTKTGFASNTSIAAALITPDVSTSALDTMMFPLKLNDDQDRLSKATNAARAKGEWCGLSLLGDLATNQLRMEQAVTVVEPDVVKSFL